MKAADYLQKRGWLPCWKDYWYRAEWPQIFADQSAERLNHCPFALNTADAVRVQQAKDDADERRCVAEAIANAASRHSKLHFDAALANVRTAAQLAKTVWRELFNVEVES